MLVLLSSLIEEGRLFMFQLFKRHSNNNHLIKQLLQLLCDYILQKRLQDKNWPEGHLPLNVCGFPCNFPVCVVYHE